MPPIKGPLKRKKVIIRIVSFPETVNIGIYS